MLIENFWWLLLVACLTWYTIVTVVVSFKAVRDIRNMLARLDELRRESDP